MLMMGKRTQNPGSGAPPPPILLLPTQHLGTSGSELEMWCESPQAFFCVYFKMFFWGTWGMKQLLFLKSIKNYYYLNKATPLTLQRNPGCS